MKDYGITYFLTAEDERYPILVMEGKFGVVGYSVNKSNGDLRRICICHAKSPSECVCNAWSE